jgi:CheY-like chemotaxis protein
MNKMRVLIVEDDLTSRMMLKAILNKWGYEVLEATNGMEGWEMLQTQDPPRLLVLDWMMPQLTGPGLCEKIEKELNREQFYILLLTARGERQDMISGLEAGADDYIAKPWNNDELKARLNVGKRVLSLLDQAYKRQKLQGVLEMAGAICHELNQPLQAALGFADLLLEDIDQDDPNRETLENIVKSVSRMGELTRKIMNITDSSAVSYMEGSFNIIDINDSGKHKSE